MTTWGTDSWGLGSWGGFPVPTVAAGVVAPLITLRDPTPGRGNVLENAVITIHFFDADFDLDTTTPEVDIDGAAAFRVSTGFAAGYVGTTNYVAGTYIVQFTKLTGWVYGSTVTVRASIDDLAANTVNDTWSFSIQADPVCYAGLTPLAVETRLQSAFTTYIALEPIREHALNSVLKEDGDVFIKQRLAKASRVIYQLGFSTELSTVLNPFSVKNDVALESVVCERQNTLVIDTAFQARKKEVALGIQGLKTLGAIDAAYFSAFNDYFESALYNYRVSLVCNALLLAAALELQG